MHAIVDASGPSMAAAMTRDLILKVGSIFLKAERPSEHDTSNPDSFTRRIGELLEFNHVAWVQKNEVVILAMLGSKYLSKCHILRSYVRVRTEPPARDSYH